MYNTPAFSQRRWSYQAQPTTANTTYTTGATNTKLLCVAGPDGSVITKLHANPLVTIGTALQLQLFKSNDFGTTFFLDNSALMAIYSLNQTSAIPLTNFTQPDGLTISETNGYPIKGSNTPIFTLTGSQITPSGTYFNGGLGGGSANVQTSLINWQNGVISLVPGAPATGTVVDFIPSFTNTGTCTLQVGSQSVGVAVQIFGTGTALAGGELTKGYPVRVVWAGSAWWLLPTERIYCAIGASLAVSFEAQGIDF